MLGESLAILCALSWAISVVLFKKAELSGSSNPSTLFKLAEGLIKSGDRESARTSLAAIVKDDPDWCRTVLGTPDCGFSASRKEAVLLLSHVAVAAGYEVKPMTAGLVKFDSDGAPVSTAVLTEPLTADAIQSFVDGQ